MVSMRETQGENLYWPKRTQKLVSHLDNLQDFRGKYSVDLLSLGVVTFSHKARFGLKKKTQIFLFTEVIFV